MSTISTIVDKMMREMSAYTAEADEQVITLMEKLAVAEWRIVRLQAAVGISRIYVHPCCDVGRDIVEKYSAELDAMNAAGWLAFVGWWG